MTKKYRRKFRGGSLTKKAMCAPGKRSDHTCYTDESLMKMRTFWNNSYPNNKIRATNAKEIWKQLYKKMNSTCTKENCWLEQPFLREKIDEEMRDSFAPKHPDSWRKNPTEWLSNVDISNVLKQFEKHYKCFKFMGPYPIDFASKQGNTCVEEEMCNFHIKEWINKNKTKIGFVFNTDPHDKGGEHWISLFINIKTEEIFFFDSAGDKITPEIQKFVDKVIQHGKEIQPPKHFTFDENAPFKHQRTTTECGMYSLYFIINMLKDKINKKLLKTQRIPDLDMIKHRKIYFNEP